MALFLIEVGIGREVRFAGPLVPGTRAQLLGGDMGLVAFRTGGLRSVSTQRSGMSTGSDALSVRTVSRPFATGFSEVLSLFIGDHSLLLISVPA
jgi:Na+/alanine symporter